MKFTGTPTEVYNQFGEYLDKLDQDKEVILLVSSRITKEIKTRYQEQLYYGLFGEIEKQTPFSADTIKQYLLGRTFGKKEVFGELINRKTKTSELTKQEAKELIESIYTFCTEHTLHVKYTSRDMQSLLDTYS